MTLAPTLAQRVAQIREYRNLTVRDLSYLTRFSIQRLEDIEAGLETWLSATDRQLLARALTIDPRILQDVEAKSNLGDDSGRNVAILKNLGEQILTGLRDLECHQCGSTLKCSVQEGFDLEGARIYLPKAFCPKCPFILK